MFFRRFVVSSSSRQIICKMHSKRAFNSFVFFDLETTGLQRPVEITEICFISVLKDHLLASGKTKSKPRLLDKMTICVRPAQEIEPGAQAMTNLSNIELQDCKNFDIELANSLKAFLLRQKPPCCLVAHGGDRYDFDILSSEFSQVNVEFPSSVQVADSCSAFRALHKDLRSQTSDLSSKRHNFGNEKISHNLGNLYKRYTGKDIEGSHTAEGDSMALLELVIFKTEILEYIENIAHNIGNGSQNRELSTAKESHVSSQDTEEDDEKQVLDEYFDILEHEGIIKK